ncbi:hypothetical protein DRQ12_12300 [candidate division KSB1 bacterium]|nr:MAG: hypothetical protein DRQ12_12300 [candidate division KSB1 bacterium]
MHWKKNPELSLEQRIPVLKGYPGSGIWWRLADVSRDGREDFVVENEFYQLVISSAFPGISSWKIKTCAEGGYRETIEPESCAVGELRGAVWGEEMYYVAIGADTPWDGRMKYHSDELTYWWDGIALLFTPMREVNHTRKVRFRVKEYPNSVHVVQTVTFSPKYEPVVKIEYHYIFMAGQKTFLWHNLRKYGAIDAPPGSSTRIERMNVAGKVPVGWALPCNKIGLYDSYFWSEEEHGLYNQDWREYLVYRWGKEIEWFKRPGGPPPNNIMMYYDSKGINGGHGVVVANGWTDNCPNTLSTMSGSWPGAWRIDDTTSEDKLEPDMETYGGLCAPFITAPTNPIAEAKQIRDQFVGTDCLDAPPSVRSTTAILKEKKGISVFVINPREGDLNFRFKLKDMEKIGLIEQKTYTFSFYSQQEEKWINGFGISGAALVSEGLPIHVDSGEIGYFKLVEK